MGGGQLHPEFAALVSVATGSCIALCVNGGQLGLSYRGKSLQSVTGERITQK
jgi:hypothetical protein